jgi:cytochrome P450
MPETVLPIEWTQAQPYEQWRKARESGCPIIENPPSDFSPRTGYQVTDWQNVEAVLRDPETFSSSINSEHIGQFMGDLILALDGPEHRRYRNLVAPAFRMSQLERWDETLVGPAIDRLLDTIAPNGRSDLVAELTTKYPVQVICGIAGVPLEDAEQFATWAEQINTGPLNPPVGLAASQAMVDYLRPLVEARRAEPTGDFLSDLVNSEIDGEKLTDSKIYGFLRLLLPAGAETTFRVMGNCLVALLSHPGVYEQVVADRSLMPEVIEETLRWETSVTMVSRVSAKDTEIAGCPVKAGSPIGVLTGSANHDPDRFEDPTKWRLGRPVQHHVAFGTGPHQCLGMHLARLELRVGLDRILDRLPNLRIDPDQPAPVIEGFAFRGPDRLPVLFDPS